MANRIEITRNTLKINVNKLKDFLKNIQDLTKIDSKVHITLNDNILLMYSYVGVGEIIHAFKSHTMKTDEIFFKKQKSFEKDMSFIIPDGKKFFKNLQNFVDFEEDLDMKFAYNEDYFCDLLTTKNSQLKLEVRGGDPSSFKFKIDVDMIKEVMDTSSSDFSFNLSKLQFDKIKKMSSIETENDIFYMNIEDKTLTIGENRWNLKIDELETDEYNEFVASFPKKYFNSINYTQEDTMKIYVFGTFILAISELSNLLISIEEYA